MIEEVREAAYSQSFRNVYDALAKISSTLLTLIKDNFNSNHKLIDFLFKRIDKAKEIIDRAGRTYFTADEVREVIPSSKTIELGMPRKLRVKTLDGEETTLRLGVPEENAYHITRVSRFRLKCTCWDSIRTSSTADRKLSSLIAASETVVAPASNLIFSKYVLCKHTIASLARALYFGELNLDDRELLTTLKLALFGAYLRVEESPNPEIVHEFLNIIRIRED